MFENKTIDVLVQCPSRSIILSAHIFFVRDLTLFHLIYHTLFDLVKQLYNITVH